jgi:alpha-1,2-mannosyltransferase
VAAPVADPARSTRGSRGPAARRRYLAAIGGLALFAAMTGLVLASAGSTLGYDYTCYAGAARHLLDGRPIYDNAFSISVGTCPGTYTYPPPFALAIVPWLALGDHAAVAWCLAMAACFLAGLALLPVRREVRIAVLVLAALDWPLLYAIKLGQVEPLLFLAFAAAWRLLDRPEAVGLSAAVGALVKVQPGLIAAWALATRRFRAVAWAAASGLILAGAATLVTGLGAWTTYSDLLRGLGGTFDTAHNFAPGAIAFQAGASLAVASAVQIVSIAVAVALLLAAWRWTSPAAGLLATFLASQLLSSPIRDHYAALLLLPVAWLLARGRTWAIVFPIAGWASLFADSGPGSWIAAATVPVAFFACLAVVLVEGIADRREAGPRHSAVGATTAA